MSHKLLCFSKFEKIETQRGDVMIPKFQRRNLEYYQSFVPGPSIGLYDYLLKKRLSVCRHMCIIFMHVYTYYSLFIYLSFFLLLKNFELIENLVAQS